MFVLHSMFRWIALLHIVFSVNFVVPFIIPDRVFTNRSAAVFRPPMQIFPSAAVQFAAVFSHHNVILGWVIIFLYLHVYWTVIVAVHGELSPFSYVYLCARSCGGWSISSYVSLRQQAKYIRPHVCLFAFLMASCLYGCRGVQLL